MTAFDDPLSLDDLCRAGGVDPQWVRRMVAEGLLPVLDGGAVSWRFDLLALRRVRLMSALERDFEAGPELAALVTDLHDEIARLRSRLRRAGLA